MVQPTYPGVYVEEVSSGVRPITAASTSTAAFIGQAEKGLIGEPVKIYNFTEFQDQYGDFLSGSYLAHAVFQFFNNGGSQCYIVRVAGANVEIANIALNDRGAEATPPVAPQKTLTIAASSPGTWGNKIEVVVSNGTNDAGNEFKLEVYMEGESTPRETFDNLTMVGSVANFVGTVTATSNYIRATVDPANTNAVAGTSVGSGPVVAPAVNHTKLQININSDGYQEIDLQDAIGKTINAVLIDDLTTATKVAAAIRGLVRGEDGLPGLTKFRASSDQLAFDNFDATADGSNVLTLTSGITGKATSVTVAPALSSDEDSTGFLNLGKLQGGLETLGGAITRPVNNTVTIPHYLVGDHDTSDAPVVSVQAGKNGDAIVSDTTYSEAFTSLDNIDDVSLLAVPGIGSSILVGDGMNYCETRSLSDCFFIGDMASIDDTVLDAQIFVSTNLSPKNSYGSVYMPWLLAPDPTGVSAEPIAVPPSGYVAGMYAKTDNNRGVWKAPAGIETALAGSSGLVANLTDVEHGNLNVEPYNVNVIRQFKNAGRVIWGARTISSDPEYRYVPVRRMAIMLRVSLYRGTQWVVFEPNDEPLWAQIRLNVGAFMHNLFRQGAFQGKSPKEAYLVKCDAETTTQNDINLGIVNIIVGFAPLKPAEFVMIKIQQLAGQVEA